MTRIKSSPAPYLLGIAGLLAGVLNGLLGCGGGIILVFALYALLPKTDGSDESAAARTRDVFALTVSSLIPMSITSAFFYNSAGALPVVEFLPYALPALLGGLAGGLLLDRISTRLLSRIFALLIIYSGIKIIIQ